jgi:hypothetical protein
MGMQKSLDELSKEELLKRAKGHIFSTGLPDSANALCNENMRYGLAKLHCTQYSLGLEPNATFIGSPDSTVSRNMMRWQHGFGYGGKISWGDGKEKLVVLDPMPNACGMLVGGLDELPNMNHLLEEMNTLIAQEDTIDGITIQWDFAVGNHFIDLFEVKLLSLDFDLPFEYTFIIHSSVPELKGDNDTKYGFGLYHHRSKILQELVEIVNTPFGDMRILTGDNAEKYLDFYRYAEAFSKRKRLKAAEYLFGEFKEITNPVHQGLLNMNEIKLGVQNTKDDSTRGLFPIALRPDIPAYLVQGEENFSEDAIEYLGFNKRADKYGVRHRLLNANILPHGGGYIFPQIEGVKCVIETSSGIRYFVTELSSGVEAEKIFATPRELQFSYRGRQVVLRTLELNLGTVVARLVPKMVMKI